MKVFISHSSDDKRFVRTLKTDLNENGVHTWVDEDELNFGDSLLEKLENSIDDTSHFIIILSESSINSTWVQMELKKVLKDLTKKIIPIKYKNCDVPEELSKMLFGDVSEIVRVVEGDKLIFRDEKYHAFIGRLIKALTSQSSKLSHSDKKVFTALGNIEEKSDLPTSNKKYLSLRIKGFLNNETKEKFITKVRTGISETELNKIKNNINRPVILPQIFKEIYPKIGLGDRITFKNKSGEKRIGIFAGFRNEDDSLIILPVSIRNYLNIIKSESAHDIVASTSSYELMIL